MLTDALIARQPDLFQTAIALVLSKNTTMDLLQHAKIAITLAQHVPIFQSVLLVMLLQIKEYLIV